jgi:hypothetical protein
MLWIHIAKYQCLYVKATIYAALIYFNATRRYPWQISCNDKSVKGEN